MQIGTNSSIKMNRKLIEKVIKAIEDNKLDYARGILDTIMESLPEEKVQTPTTSTPVVNTVIAPVTSTQMDEGTMLDAIAKTNLEKIKNGMTQE